MSDGEVFDYEMDDFISLERVAEKIAERLDDKPDMLLTMERCVKAGVSLAIWNGKGVNVWRYRPETEKNHSYPLMGCGDYITLWENVFFLESECTSALYNSGGKVIYWAEFSPHEGGCTLCDRLTVASSRDIGRVMYKDNEVETLTEYSAQNVNDLPDREREFLKTLGDSTEEASSDDGYLEVDISVVKVLRSDLVKLGLSESKLQQEAIKPKKASFSKANSFVSAAYESYKLEFGEPPSGYESLFVWVLGEGRCIGYEKIRKEGTKFYWDGNSITIKYAIKAFESLDLPSCDVL